MNSHNLRAGINLGLTAAGTILGGPVGGMIGGGIATLAGGLIPTKENRFTDTSFVNANIQNSFSPGDYGKGYIKSDRYEAEAPTTESGIMDFATKAIPFVSSMSKPSIDTTKETASTDKVIKQSIPDLGASMSTNNIDIVKPSIDNKSDVIEPKTNTYVRDIETRPKPRVNSLDAMSKWSTQMFGGIDLSNHEDVDNIDKLSENISSYKPKFVDSISNNPDIISNPDNNPIPKNNIQNINDYVPAFSMFNTNLIKTKIGAFTNKDKFKFK